MATTGVRIMGTHSVASYGGRPPKPRTRLICIRVDGQVLCREIPVATARVAMETLHKTVSKVARITETRMLAKVLNNSKLEANADLNKKDFDAAVKHLEMEEHQRGSYRKQLKKLYEEYREIDEQDV
jgi:hypothetical protein